MHAFLVIGSSENYINKINGKKIEFPFKKIDDVRDLYKFTRLKLIEKTTIILKDFNKSTEEAQSAFLKSLEEPQENLNFVLLSENVRGILPTILSRCEVVVVPYIDNEISEIDKKKAIDFINGGVDIRLEIASSITKRDEALYFADNLIIEGHKLFLDKPKLQKFLKEALKLKSSLEANGNVCLQLTRFIMFS